MNGKTHIIKFSLGLPIFFLLIVIGQQFTYRRVLNLFSFHFTQTKLNIAQLSCFQIPIVPKIFFSQLKIIFKISNLSLYFLHPFFILFNFLTFLFLLKKQNIFCFLHLLYLFHIGFYFIFVFLKPPWILALISFFLNFFIILPSVFNILFRQFFPLIFSHFAIILRLQLLIVHVLTFIFPELIGSNVSIIDLIIILFILYRKIISFKGTFNFQVLLLNT